MKDDAPLPAVAVLGEILWDVFGDSRRLGGAPLNFAAHARSLGHPVSLISALGEDALGREAAEQIAALGLDMSLLQTSKRYPTGTASVRLDAHGNAEFTIARPAAFDAIEPDMARLRDARRPDPAWFYFGTLIAATSSGRQVLDRLLERFAGATRFLDLNLRPGSDSPELATSMLERADVVKLNENELACVHDFAGLPQGAPDFCRAASERYGWDAVAVTLGERGCVMLAGGELVEGSAVAITVADTVGAGDAFAAAFMHGLSRRWRAGDIAAFANRIAASVAARPGSLPER